MDNEPEIGERLSLKVAVLLALGLLGTVVILNLLGSPEIPISNEQFLRLQKDRVIQTLKIAPGGWHIQLTRPCRIDNGGGEFITKQVLVGNQGEPTGEMLERWRSQGVVVERIADPPQKSGWAGGVLVGGLLSLGLWHLWQQMQRHRREGSPRQHLEELERELKAGKINQEDFQRRAEALMAEM